MNKTTTITEGQSLLDVALQELGSVATLFELADAAGMGITDMLSAGQVLEVPAAAAARPEVAGYYQGRQYRVNTSAEAAPMPPPIYDYNRTDYSPLDYNA